MFISLSFLQLEYCVLLFLQFPSTEDEWIQIANDFEKKCNFVNCVGAVDGKHVNIIPPAGSGSYYFNYKGTHSLVLLAVVNANCEFIMCDFGINGRISDGGVIEYTKFYKKLKNEKLLLPLPRKPNSGDKLLPFVFVGDEAFTLLVVTYNKGCFSKTASFQGQSI